MIQIHLMFWTRSCTKSFTAQHQSKRQTTCQQRRALYHVVLLNSGNVTTMVSRFMFLQKYNGGHLKPALFYVLFDSRVLNSTPVIVRMSVRLALLVSCQAFLRPPVWSSPPTFPHLNSLALPSRKSSTHLTWPKDHESTSLQSRRMYSARTNQAPPTKAE